MLTCRMSMTGGGAAGDWVMEKESFMLSRAAAWQPMCVEITAEGRKPFREIELVDAKKLGKSVAHAANDELNRNRDEK